jgi:hypothetical protein
VPQGSGAAKRLWGFGHVGGADEVRAAQVERYFWGIGRMSGSVQMSAVLVTRGDCECSCSRIAKIDASPGTAGGEPAKASLVVIVDRQ